MREDAISIEEERIGDLSDINDYPSFHERHRIFPDIFENRKHRNIIDLSAGVGIVGKRIRDYYSSSNLLCNDISSSCLNSIKTIDLQAISFDLDINEINFPFSDESFDAVITLATIEHIIHIDRFVQEIHRILQTNGFLYISAPNYSGLLYLLPFLISGRTFHNPISEKSKYEFYAHVRYFTFKTLIEYISTFGFVPDTVYLPLPDSSSRYLALKSKSQFKAIIFRRLMKLIYVLFSPRFASEPVICFEKNHDNHKKYRKVIL